MVKESVRRCSHCGHDGHNSRTCNGKGCLKLFGVTIVAQKEDESIRKCKSTGDLVACNGEHGGVDAGYLSDGLIQSERAHERKKGVPWTEEEHRSFLAGLENIGKGDWRGISKNYVPSRTPTQVASHAQKYFIRLAATDKKKRRSSLFDMSFKEPEIHHSPPPPPPELPVSPPDKTAEISQQASTSAQLTSPLAAPPVLLLATSYGVPDFRPMPYTPMVGVTSNGQNFPGAKVFPTAVSGSSVPVMNFHLPKSLGNFATCAPYLSLFLPLSGLSPQPLSHGSSSQAGPETSISGKDGLELHIGVI